MKWQKSMVRLLGGSAICGMLFLACGKDSFNTKPSLEFLSTGSRDLRQGDLLQINLLVRDKEGDLNDTLFMEASTRLCPANKVLLKYQMPEIPPKNNFEGKINVIFLVNVLGDYPIWNLNLCSGPDSVNFRFWIKDKAQNVSDTVSTPEPIIIRNS
jgi:hypothetical protein